MAWSDFLELAIWLKALIGGFVIFSAIKMLLPLTLGRFKDVPTNSPHFYKVVLGVAARKTKFWFIAVLAVFIGCVVFAREESWFGSTQRTFFVLSMIQVWFWMHHFVAVYVQRRTQALAPEDISKATSFRALAFVSYILIFIILILFTLDNFGVNISALVAGLGVGGIAVALAVQNILGDLFASVTIILDKPFVVGDFIVVGDVSGTIESIGIKTTRVRSLGGELVVFSNADLLQSRIRNYKALYERRIVFAFGVLYETPLDTLKTIPDLVKKIIGDVENTRVDRAHFLKFGDSSLDFEVVYYVTAPDYGTYMDAQQKINLTLMAEFQKLKVDFAYPTRTLYVQNLQGEPEA